MLELFCLIHLFWAVTIVTDLDDFEFDFRRLVASVGHVEAAETGAVPRDGRLVDGDDDDLVLAGLQAQFRHAHVDFVVADGQYDEVEHVAENANAYISRSWSKIDQSTPTPVASTEYHWRSIY